MYENCLKLDERSPRIAYKLALARYQDGDLNAAILAARQALRLSDGMPEAYYILGLALRDKRRNAEAMQAFEKAISIAPGLIPAREQLADLYAASGRLLDELGQLKALAVIDRDHVERQVAVAMAYAKAGNTDLAVLTLTHVLEGGSDQPAVYAALGNLWFDIAATRKDHPEALSKALEALGRASSTNAATSELLTVYGRALLQAGDVELAVRTLQQATTTYPVDPSAFALYATVAERVNDLQAARDALIDYTALVADEADFPARATRIAALSLRLDDVATAIEWLQKSAAANPADVKVLASLAEAQVRYGDYDAARTTIAKGLEKEPGNTQLLLISRKLGIRN
jgi:tetratricopeptide (TPR) repeat protein